MIRLAALVLVAAVTVGGCSSDPKDAYCDQVTQDQAKLSDVLDGGGSDALIKALPLFEGLHDKAPEDIRDEWTTLNGAIAGLRDALDDAGVDASTYKRSKPPAGLTTAQKDAIDAAARKLSDPTTVAAFEGVQQQARDVCGTPLSI